MQRTATLSSLAYELGRPRSITELGELQELPELLAALSSKEAGLGYFLESEATLCDLAQSAAEQTLEESGVAPRNIGAVIFASDSFRNIPEQYAELGRFLESLELSGAYPLNITLSDCANVQIALRVAASLVRSGELDHVLLVSADLAHYASPGTRIIGNGIAIASDAAACALISAEDSAPLVIKAVAQETAVELLDPGDDDHVLLASRVKAHRALFGRLFAAAALSATGVRQVFANNFARNVLRIFMADNGFSEDQVYLDNVRRVGHCLGSDCLINLLDYAHRNRIQAGEQFVLLGSGASQLGAVLLEATHTTTGEGLEVGMP